ncbi:Uncharacterised protein [Bordetella pertussis]|nr:Uncharacterised protein [Bordetella pertussis]
MKWLAPTRLRGPYQMAVLNSLAQAAVAVASQGQRHAPMNSPGAIRLFWGLPHGFKFWDP